GPTSPLPGPRARSPVKAVSQHPARELACYLRYRPFVPTQDPVGRSSSLRTKVGMTTRSSDFTPIIDLVAKPGTGPVRERRPIYVDLLPPCNNACPAGENIQAWLAHAQAGRHREAWLTLVRDNPLPAVHGRVCYHPCESHCNREPIDSAVSIHAVERFLGDRAGQEGWRLPI